MHTRGHSDSNDSITHTIGRSRRVRVRVRAIIVSCILEDIQIAIIVSRKVDRGHWLVHAYKPTLGPQRHGVSLGLELESKLELGLGFEAHTGCG